MNENNDDFGSMALRVEDVIKRIKALVVKHQDKPIAKVFRIDPEDGALVVNGEKSGSWGMPPVRAIMKDLIYLDMLERANASVFFNHHAHRMTADERIAFMEKYGVQIDPDKKKKNDTKKGVGEKTADADDPNINVPKDPDKGTEPFEKEKED